MYKKSKTQDYRLRFPGSEHWMSPSFLVDRWSSSNNDNNNNNNNNISNNSKQLSSNSGSNSFALTRVGSHIGAVTSLQFGAYHFGQGIPNTIIPSSSSFSQRVIIGWEKRSGMLNPKEGECIPLYVRGYLAIYNPYWSVFPFIRWTMISLW